MRVTRRNVYIKSSYGLLPLEYSFQAWLFFCWFVLGAWIQSVTVGAHLKILIIHTEMHEFTATSFVKELFIPHKFMQEQEWLDSKCLSTETKRAHSRPVQHPFSPRAQTVRQIFLNYYQCRICAMAKLLCFTSKCFTTPQHAFAWHTVPLIVVTYYEGCIQLWQLKLRWTRVSIVLSKISHLAQIMSKANSMLLRALGNQ